MILGAAQYNDPSTSRASSRLISVSLVRFVSGQVNGLVLGMQVKWTKRGWQHSLLLHPLFIEMAVPASADSSVHDLGVNGVRGTRVNMEVLFGPKQASDLRVVTVS